ncbi:MAG: pyruvate dehydrogenase complex dihydrolipoamide acetyltransferase [Bacteroidia bacterium]|nr:pyruvate dehydrogenase complex dihydrolipoamide acetyltransferase [Bacteroidia bacterium]NNJ56479.1 pyruvate dehydrogenase complex dihydrolipoamide acetyltransferase [Bacteroidia bacterium]
MAVAIKLPRMSDTMEEGTIVSWFVKVGDTVKSSEMIADVETDKATMELENFEKGEVLHLNVKEGETVPVETVIAIIGKKGEDFQDLLSAAPTAPKAEERPAEIIQESVSFAPEQAPAAPAPVVTATNGRVFASPLAKSMAEERGINLNQVSGTGDNGRIVKRDIENFKVTPGVATSTSVGVESFEDVPVTQMRKTIAKRLAESKFTAPHFYLTMEVKMDAAMEARKRMNEYSETKISMNDLIVKAVAVGLKQHPNVNSAWLGDKIRRNHHVHIGVAVAVEDGLLVPVVRFADSKSLSQIGAEVKDLAGKAKNKELQPKDWEGNTFTISNLGMFGIDEFTAIVNPPDACILAVGGAKETVIVENGEMKPGHIMKVTLSCDHRVVDGVTGAKFLNTFKELLEEPVRLLV